MSTKWQYHVANSKPKWCSNVKWLLMNRIKQTKIKIVPIITWVPWSPVIIKNKLPKIPSDIAKEASRYSRNWKQVKTIA